jgi:hypothetical protein
MKMVWTQCSETSAYKIQTPGNYPEENTQQMFCSLWNDLTHYKMLCLDIDMGWQRQVMRNLRIGLIGKGRCMYVCIFRLTDTICIFEDHDIFYLIVWMKFWKVHMANLVKDDLLLPHVNRPIVM